MIKNASLLSRQYFNGWCRDIMGQENATSHEKRLAIQCLRIFSDVFYKYLSSDEVTSLFLTIMQNFEYNYVLNYNPSSEQWEFLPYYVQTIANLMQFKSFSSSEFYCLQRAVINMIKSFHQLPHLHHDLVIDGIVTACFYLKKTKYFDVFIENIIYQGVVWTCCHEHISKEDFSEETDEKVITIKKFKPLWAGILNLSSNQSYNKYGMNLDDRKHILVRIVNQFVKTLMVLINKLNISVRLKGENTATELEEAYQVEQTNDYAIFLNVVDFYQEIFRFIDPKMFEKCICRIIKHFINKCIEFPLISGFYKLLSYSLKNRQQSGFV
ncbi:hypothetical protein NQ317_010041 [Molorchus minor]|uniref:DNA-PKcs N-terminal domain-containing protein n=1 Tax=Molorchus minor TaxID=1323400 RepID=A0ABQ9J6U9_9CUCU|nr:hypothetical protein NQ317_010041 [Molorchus minor]